MNVPRTINLRVFLAISWSLSPWYVSVSLNLGFKLLTLVWVLSLLDYNIYIYIYIIHEGPLIYNGNGNDKLFYNVKL